MSPAPALRHGPLDACTVHLCVDMQRLFIDDTPWRTPWAGRVLPVVTRIAERHPERTIFTRFIPPERPEDMAGAWVGYYRRWREMTRERLEPRLLELAPSLAALAPPATVVDKRFYSPFTEPTLLRVLRERRVGSLVVTGAETDVCVLAAVLGAVDHGFRVVLAADAVCSSSDRTHDALMTLYRERFSQQIEAAETEEILAAWR
jgi:nicotinamidase-related amidase